MSGPGRRPTVRSVAMPAEHGGWGLTIEPGLLGVLLAPSLAAVVLGVAALLVFLVRTPSRLVLVGRRHAADRPTTASGVERSRLAARVATVELAAMVLAVVLTVLLAADPWWWLPMVVAAPLFVLALWFDMRSLSRHLVPEIVGSVAVASVAAMGARAGGAPWPLAVSAWIILIARIASSIPHVRAQVQRIHGRRAPVSPTIVGDVAALAAALIAVVVEPNVVLGAAAIVGLIVVQRITLARPPRPAKVLGLRQMVLGFGVVGATATSAWLL
jgi:hypothetical protein